MKIILTQNVANLGSLGDEVQVKDGYARNFLLPRGLAMPAGGRNAKTLRHHRQFLEKQRAEAIDTAQDQAGRVEALELVVKARAGTGGRLFGSVTNRDLQALLAERGFEVDRKAITLHTPVKSLGTFAATVKLHTDVKVELQFKVESAEVVASRPDAEGEAGAEEAGAAEGSGEAGAAEGAEGAAEATPSAAPGEGAATPAASPGGEAPFAGPAGEAGEETETGGAAIPDTPGAAPGDPEEPPQGG